jgi:hypothetical protein
MPRRTIVPDEGFEETPTFRQALWGYDRSAVDSFVANLTHRLEEEGGKGSRPREHALRDAGSEAATMLARAAELADEVGRRAEGQARELVAAAEAKAASLIGDARRDIEEQRVMAARAVEQAKALRASAQEEIRRVAETAQAEAARRLEGVRAELSMLENRRQAVVRELLRLRDRLDEVIPKTGRDPGTVIDLTDPAERSHPAARRTS